MVTLTILVHCRNIMNIMQEHFWSGGGGGSREGVIFGVGEDNR